MKSSKTWFILVFVVASAINVSSNSSGNNWRNYDAPYDRDRELQTGQQQPIRKICPHHGQCVPKIRCPAHVRPGAFTPECYLRETRQVGVCCFTGTHHAAKHEQLSHKNAFIDKNELDSAQNSSDVKVKQLFRKSEQLLKYSNDTTILVGTPDFGEHMTFISYDDQEAVRGRGALLNLFATEELKNSGALDDQELLLGLTEHTDAPYCPPLPSCPEKPSRYRTINGACNNLNNPDWGAANTAFERLLPPDYSNGIWSLRTSVTGDPLPSPRAISATVITDSSHLSPTLNMVFMQLSQFIAHDLSSSVMFNTNNGSLFSCCTKRGGPLPPEKLHFACAPIPVEPEDEFYSQFGKTCLSFVRAQLAPSSDCTVGYAKQMNSATHFLDLSQLYGKTLGKQNLLRSGGLMKIFSDYGRELPPLSERDGEQCMSAWEHGAWFESGDNRGNQFMSLTAMHMIFTREHNRIAKAIIELNPLLDEDTVFYEARRIVQAMFQHIVHNEWLPTLLGPRMVKEFNLTPGSGYSTSYDPDVNPSLLAEVSAAVMRFGHSTVDGKVEIPYPETGDLYELVFSSELMFEPARLRLKPLLDRLIYGLVNQPMQNIDHHVDRTLSNFLFNGGNPHGLDLVSLNIQRGRDFGLQPYNQYRRLCGLPPIEDFEDLPPSIGSLLSSVYSDPEDIDLWVGGLLEAHTEGGFIGTTFAYIIAEQFLRQKRGDRYYYENGPDVNPEAFTPSQLAEIKKVTVARILCDNLDRIELTSMPPNAFLRADLPENAAVSCDSPLIPSMDLSKFEVPIDITLKL